MKVLLFILLFPLVLYAQEVKCDHITNAAVRFERMRIFPPLKITSWNGRQLIYHFEDTESIHVGEMTVSDDTVLPDDFGKDYRRGLWWIIWCINDMHIYAIRRFEQKK